MSIRKITLASGTKLWQARVMVDGQRRSALRPTYEAAKTAEADLRRALHQEIALAGAVAARPGTVRDGLRGYVARLEARGKSPDSVARARQVEGAITAAVPGLLDRPVSSLTAEDLFAYKQARDRAGTAPSTINRDAAVVRAMLKLVRPEFHWPAELKAPEDHTRVRMLTPREATPLFATMAEPGRSMARLAALTLMRLSEIRRLRREQLDLPHGLLALPRTKTVPRQVVLSTEAQAILAAALRRPSTHGWVFPNPDDRPYSRVHISRLFRRAAQRVGLEDWHFHDLRHHGASVALNAGFSGQVVKDLGGWKSEAMMRRYAALTSTTLREAAEAVATHGRTARLRAVKKP
jgi:integrase